MLNDIEICVHVTFFVSKFRKKIPLKISEKRKNEIDREITFSATLLLLSLFGWFVWILHRYDYVFCFILSAYFMYETANIQLVCRYDELKASWNNESSVPTMIIYSIMLNAQDERNIILCEAKKWSTNSKNPWQTKTASFGFKKKIKANTQRFIRRMLWF